ncbi:hypothetical protein [Desulfoluna sp.]|uniref:hypothetical protein n=1 Tax=Desulfoluna sp. TaxID=2045199 RepID=UPI00262E3CAA|nr:hypothetical protein [Desulfoluna sp.]
MIAADPAEIKIGEEAMVERVRDGLDCEALQSLLARDRSLTSFAVDDVTLAAHNGELVFKVDLSLSVEQSITVELGLPHLCRDKEELALRCRRFWRHLKKSCHDVDPL